MPVTAAGRDRRGFPACPALAVAPRVVPAIADFAGRLAGVVPPGAGTDLPAAGAGDGQLPGTAPLADRAAGVAAEQRLAGPAADRASRDGQRSRAARDQRGGQLPRDRRRSGSQGAGISRQRERQLPQRLPAGCDRIDGRLDHRPGQRAVCRRGYLHHLIAAAARASPRPGRGSLVPGRAAGHGY